MGILEDRVKSLESCIITAQILEMKKDHEE